VNEQTPPTPVTNIPKDLKIVVKSWGLKKFGTQTASNGMKVSILPTADLYLDCRGVKEHNLAKGVSRDDVAGTFAQSIQQTNADTLNAMVTTIKDSIAQIPDRRYPDKHPYRDPFVICFFCAWGMNRSPTTKMVVAKRLSEMGYNVQVAESDFITDSTLHSDNT
jgi:hypothetical protein